MRLALAALVVAALVLAPEAWAATTAEPDWFAGLMRRFVALQAEVNRALTRGIAALRRGETDGAALAALGVGLGYGAFHALGPGHGKWVVATYFLGRDARTWRGVLMGCRIALMHVIMAVVAVIVFDQAARAVFGPVPAELPHVRAASYGLIVLLGIAMLVARLRGAGHHHQGHDHGQHEGWLAVAVGLVPCSGAVVVLAYAVANDILLAGLAVVGAIGVGMAATMAGLGLACVIARRAAVGLADGPGHGRLANALGLAGPVVMIAVGLALSATLLVGRP